MEYSNHKLPPASVSLFNHEIVSLKPHPFPLRSAFDELISPLWNSGKQQNKTVVPPIIFHHYHLPMG
jgi:hypothetical protein